MKKNYLENTTVRVTAPEGNLTQGEVVFENDPKGNLSLISGFGGDILYSLKIALGFQVEVVTAKGWATFFPENGSWFGMAQKVLDGEADFSIAKTSMLINRAEALGYLVPTHGLLLYTFFPQPHSATNVFLKVFPLSGWMLLLMTIFILLLISKFMLAMATKKFGLDNNKITSVWIIYMMSQKSYFLMPDMNFLRILLFTGMGFWYICNVCFSAELVSRFSVTSLPIKSINDLSGRNTKITVDQNNLRAINVIYDSFGNDNDLGKLMRYIKQQKISTMMSAKSGGNLVLSGEGAFITFKDTFYTTAKNIFGTPDAEFCKKVHSLPLTHERFHSGLFLNKASSLKEPFNTKIIAMYNSGLMARYVKNYENTYTPICDNEFPSPVPIIDFQDISIAVYGLCIGHTFSLTCMILEKFYHFYSFSAASLTAINISKSNLIHKDN